MRKVTLYVWLAPQGGSEDKACILPAEIDKKQDAHPEDWSGQRDIDLRKELIGMTLVEPDLEISYKEAKEACDKVCGWLHDNLLADVKKFFEKTTDTDLKKAALKQCRDLYNMFREPLNAEVLDFMEDRRCAGSNPRLG